VFPFALDPNFLPALENAMAALLPKAGIASFTGPASAWGDVADFKRTRFEAMQTAYENEATRR
jgi:hypothetical protein